MGRVEVELNRDGAAEARARYLGYFSRLADAETFTREACVELHWACIATAKTVCGVMDGADWEQTFRDVQRADAIRILDFPYAVEYLTKAAQATLLGPGCNAGRTLGPRAGACPQTRRTRRRQSAGRARSAAGW